jgi:ribosomal protein S18 acetylase RimI-like enzyme
MSNPDSGASFEFHIRVARDDDVDKMYRLEKLSFGINAFNKRQLKHLVNSKAAISFVVAANDHFVGFIIGLTSRNRYGKYGRVYTLDVDTNFRRMGIATMLMEALTERLREVGCTTCFLEVRSDDIRAISLYEKLGFTPSRVIPNYYKTGEPALKMQKSL